MTRLAGFWLTLLIFLSGPALGAQVRFGDFTIAAESETMTTVLGSGRDVAPYVGKPGFNTFTGEGITPAELDTQNSLWLNSAIQRGDNIWLVTDPAAHAELLNGLPGSPQSAYLNLELPMLDQYSGVKAIPVYGPH